MSDIAFASVDHFATRLGVSFTDAEQVRAHNLLLGASDLVEHFAGRRISHITGDVLTRRGTLSDRFKLDGPVTAVASVTSKEGTGPVITQLANSYYLYGDYLIREGGQYWFDSSTVLTITYDHGWLAIPPIASQITIEAAVRAWINPGSVVSETHGSESASYGPNPMGLILTEWERTMLHREFGSRSGVRSVQLT